MNIYLIGMMGSGKTTIARNLSKIINKNYIDTDSIIEVKENMTINEIFSKLGESHFRKIESEVLQSIANDSIIACGGGIILKKVNREFLKKSGITVYLKTSIPILVNRLKGQNLRPLINDKNITNALIDIFYKREILYEKTANVQIDTDDKTIEDIIFNLKEKLIIEEN